MGTVRGPEAISRGWFPSPDTSACLACQIALPEPVGSRPGERRLTRVRADPGPERGPSALNTSELTALLHALCKISVVGVSVATRVRQSVSQGTTASAGCSV